MSKPEKNTKPSGSTEVIDLRLQKAMTRLEKALENYQQRSGSPSGVDTSLIMVLEKRIESLQHRIDELEVENSSLKKQIDNSTPFFETVKQKQASKKQPQQKKDGDGTPPSILSQVKNLFDDE